jgi:hypothetical protein
MELKAWERKQCDANNRYGAVGYGKLQTDGKASGSYVYGGIWRIARSRKCESGSLLHLCDSHIHYSFHLEGLRSIACRVFMNPPGTYDLHSYRPITRYLEFRLEFLQSFQKPLTQTTEITYIITKWFFTETIRVATPHAEITGISTNLDRGTRYPRISLLG